MIRWRRLRMAAKARRKILVRRGSRRPVWDGIVRIFDFTGSLKAPKRMLPPDVADRNALWMDWKTVGDDLRTVISDHEPDRVSSHSRRSRPKIG